MSLRNAYSTDKTKEVNGVELECDAAPGVFFTIRRQGGNNKLWAKTLEEVTKPFRRQMELKTIKNEKAEELMREAFAKAVVVGWRGVSQFDISGDPSHKEIEWSFSVANCLALFVEMPDIYEELQKKSTDIDNFRNAALEVESGN